MTLRELTLKFNLHNLAPPHNQETCEVCKEYQSALKNPSTYDPR